MNTEEETANLLDLLAAANVLNRFEAQTPDVWHAALADLEYRDCMQAAANLIRTQQWVKICDIRDAVHRIRAQRIAAANPLYDGNPHETPEDGVQNLRALIGAAGAGLLPTRTITAALEAAGTDEELDERTEAALAAVGRHVPGPRAGVVNVLAVACPHCHALPGNRCTAGRRKLTDPHWARLDDARRIAAGQAPRDRASVELEVQQQLAYSRRAIAALPPGETPEPDDGFERAEVS